MFVPHSVDSVAAWDGMISDRFHPCPIFCRRIRSHLPGFLLDALLLDREESGETILQVRRISEKLQSNSCFECFCVKEVRYCGNRMNYCKATCLALPYLVLVVVFIQQLRRWKIGKKRPQPTQVLYVPGHLFLYRAFCISGFHQFCLVDWCV